MTFKPDAAPMSAIPQASTSTPATDQVDGTPGSAPMRFSQEGHSHPTIRSTTYITLGANGQAFALFSRTFTNKPGLVLAETDAVAGSQPLVLRGLDWQKDANGRFYGVTIEGKRAQLLPQLTAISGLISLLSGVINGVNSFVTTLTGYNVFGGSVVGATVSVSALARSDVPAT